MVSTKPKTYRRYTKDKEEENKAYRYKKSSNLQKKTEREEETKEQQNSQKAINKMSISSCLSIITLNVNGLNSPIKRHTVVKFFFKSSKYMLFT